MQGKTERSRRPEAGEAGRSFVRQAGILAAAGIISRIVGMLYKSPATAIIGDEGMGYFTPAYNIYALILLISSYSIPSAISKVISQRLALREYKNAQRIFDCSLFYVMAVGLAGSLLAFFGATVLVGEMPAPVLQVLAPTIFFSGLLGAFRGFFQAHGTMVQTAASQILEQIVHVTVSVLAAWLMVRAVTASSSGALSAEVSTMAAQRGAMGAAVGVDVGVLAALLFLAALYIASRPTLARQRARDPMPREKLLSWGAILRIILFMVTPIILSTFIYNFSTSLNQTIFLRVQENYFGMESRQVHTLYGLFANKAVTLSNIPIALASAMSSAVMPAIAASCATGDREGVRGEIQTSIRATMYLSIPCAAGLIVLARPIVYLLFPQESTVGLSANLLMSIGVSVIFYSLSTLTNGILQALGKVNQPVKNAAISLILQTAVLALLLFYTDLGVYSLAVAMVLYSSLMCLLNHFSVRKATGYRQEYKKTFLLPCLSALLMSVLAVCVYWGLDFLLPASLDPRLSNLLCLAPALAAGAFSYFLFSLRVGATDEKDLRALPGGRYLIRIARGFHLL